MTHRLEQLISGYQSKFWIIFWIHFDDYHGDIKAHIFHTDKVCAFLVML